MRKPKPLNESLQVTSALDKAERELREAIEISERKDRKARLNDAEKESGNSMEGDIAEFLESTAAEEEENGEDREKGRKSEVKSIYGFAPELSRSSKIENSIDDLKDEEQRKLVESLLKNHKVDDFKQEAEKNALMEKLLEDHLYEDYKHSLEEKEKTAATEDFEDLQAYSYDKITAEDLVSDVSLLNDEFHSGFDSLDEIGHVNKFFNKTDKKLFNEELLRGSVEYEVKSFSEDNQLTDEEYDFDADEIMPREFSLSHFEDSDEEIEPYDINKALILGDVIPPDRVEEELTPEIETEKKTEAEAEEKEKIDPGRIIERAEAEAAKTVENAKAEAEAILLKAKAEAEKIKNNASARAEKLIEEKSEEAASAAAEKGYSEGFEKGRNEGFLEAENAVNQGMLDEAAAFREELKNDIEEFRRRRDEILEYHLDDLTDLALNVAEKVIKISLKSSKDVVSKMIVAAAEDCRNKEWAKVYISNEDREIAMNLEKELIDALNQISENVKVIVMEDEPSGTCIIESPDQIVDASVSVQLDNIKQIVSDNKR